MGWARVSRPLITSLQLKMPSPADVLQRKLQNIAVQTNPAHDLRLVKTDTPEPGPTECLVHVRATGVCGSDVHFWKHGHIGDMVVCGDNGMGHESAGVVVKTGKDVTRFKIGMYYMYPWGHVTTPYTLTPPM